MNPAALGARLGIERTTWTDERLDDMVDRLEQSIGMLRDELREMRTEMHADMREMRTDMREMRTEMHAGFTSLRRDMLYAVLAMSSVLVATMATILAKTL